jgi:hypothetical protein
MAVAGTIASSSGGTPGAVGGGPPEEVVLLDESVATTIVSEGAPSREHMGPSGIGSQCRDLRNVAGKLRLVLLPTGTPEETLRELRNWDLWGPLLLCLVLSM